MFRVIIFSFVAVQVLLVQAKTYDEVVQDLEPIFQHLHNTVAGQESFAHGSERIIEEQTRKYAYNMRTHLVSQIQSIMEYIQDTTETIIADNGMTEQLEKIEHCLTNKNTDSGLLQQAAAAGAELCVRLGIKNILFISTTIMEPMYNKHSSVHTSIIAVKKDCSNSQDAARGLLCITNALYGKWKPEIENMEAETKEAVDRVTTSGGYIVANINMCNSIVFETMNYNKKPIVDNFKKCVVEVANSANFLY